MLKKNYIAPALQCVKVNTSNMLANSYLQSTTSATTEDSGAELGVKSNNRSYDVWDDDWSN